jgi:hypothetical protein
MPAAPATKPVDGERQLAAHTGTARVDKQAAGHKEVARVQLHYHGLLIRCWTPSS